MKPREHPDESPRVGDAPFHMTPSSAYGVSVKPREHPGIATAVADT